MLKPFKATHHFEVVLKTRIVGLIAHLDCRKEVLSHPSLEGVTSFFAENRVRIVPANSKLQPSLTRNFNLMANSLFSDGTKRNLHNRCLQFLPRARYYSSLKRNTRQCICTVLGGKQGACIVVYVKGLNAVINLCIFQRKSSHKTHFN